jgi:hypothetical protein
VRLDGTGFFYFSFIINKIIWWPHTLQNLQWSLQA